MELTRSASLYNNEECVKGGLNKIYWQAKNKLSMDKSTGIPMWVWFAIGGGVLLIVAAIFIYCKCCTGKDDDENENSPGDTKGNTKEP